MVSCRVKNRNVLYYTVMQKVRQQFNVGQIGEIYVVHQISVCIASATLMSSWCQWSIKWPINACYWRCSCYNRLMTTHDQCTWTSSARLARPHNMIGGAQQLSCWFEYYTQDYHVFGTSQEFLHQLLNSSNSDTIRLATFLVL